MRNVRNTLIFVGLMLLLAGCCVLTVNLGEEKEERGEKKSAKMMKAKGKITSEEREGKENEEEEGEDEDEKGEKGEKGEKSEKRVKGEKSEKGGKAEEAEEEDEDEKGEKGEKSEKGEKGEAAKSAWQDNFNLSERTLVPTGRNPYFILEPGFQIVLEGKAEKVAISVLDETIVVDGVKTRVVEEREWKNGQLAEVSRNFFAICEKTKDVFYFGEDVDVYEKGNVVGHSGAWRAGKDGAKPGMMMPGRPAVGMKHYQEVAPKVAMDRAEVVSLTERLKTPAGTFVNCLKTQETTPLDPAEKGHKTYAPGIGIIQDEDLLLVRHGFFPKR